MRAVESKPQLSVFDITISFGIKIALRETFAGLLYPIELLLSQSRHGNGNVVEAGRTTHSVFTSVRGLGSDCPRPFDLSRPEHESQHARGCPCALRLDSLSVWTSTLLQGCIEVHTFRECIPVLQPKTASE